MKNNNQKLILVASLLLVIFLGIGFAAFSNTLTITPQASVNPNSDTFSVVFTKTSGSVDTNAVSPSKTPSSITATNGVIDNALNPTISNLSATFTAPNQKVEYNFYVYNNGQYLAYLNSITYRGSKSCTPGSGTTASLVSNACNYITMKVQIGDTTYTGTTQNITGNNLTVGQSKAVKVTIEYASGAPVADGSFTVSFPDVSLYYVTATGQNEEYVEPSNPVYKHSIVFSDSSFGANIDKTMDIYATFSDNLSGMSFPGIGTEYSLGVISATTTERTWVQGFEDRTITFDSDPTVTLNQSLVEYGSIHFTLSGTVSGVETSRSLESIIVSSDTVTLVQ